MRELMKRLERLEDRSGPRTVPRVVVTFVSPSANGPLYHRDTASDGVMGHGVTIRREPNETTEAFQERALATFPGVVYMGASDA